MEVIVSRDNVPDITPVQKPLHLIFGKPTPACDLAKHELLQFAYELRDSILDLYVDRVSNRKIITATYFDPSGDRRYETSSPWLAYVRFSNRSGETFALLKEMWRRGMDIDKIPPMPLDASVALASHKARKFEGPLYTSLPLYTSVMHNSILGSIQCVAYMTAGQCFGGYETPTEINDVAHLPRHLSL